jgi:hypothetical protein
MMYTKVVCLMTALLAFVSAEAEQGTPSHYCTVTPGVARVKFAHRAVQIPAWLDSCSIAEVQLNEEALRDGMTALGVKSIRMVDPWMRTADTLLPAFKGGMINIASYLDWYYLSYSLDANVDSTCNALERLPRVMAAEPVRPGRPLFSPNDPYYISGSQWGLYNPPGRVDIHAPEAWDVCADPRPVRVALIDAGVHSAHPDFGGLPYPNFKFPYAGLRALHFCDSLHGAAVGDGGLILQTFDGGQTWERDSSEFTSDLYAVFMLDSTRGWAAGENGLVLGFGDWAVGTDEAESPFAGVSGSGFSVGPNPCRDLVSVEFSRPLQAGQSVSLLDISGRKVADLHPGANDVRALAPGVYFVRAVSRELSAVSCSKVVITR